MSLYIKNKYYLQNSNHFAEEEFFQIPRAELLYDNQKKIGLGGIETMVRNESIRISDRFSLLVDDNRMAAAGICKGDYAVIQKDTPIEEGDIIAIKLGNKTLVRRYFLADKRIRLECTTPNRQTMILDKNTPGFSILGTVVQVIREI